MNLLQYLLFFPSFTFGLVGAEIFPWAILYAIGKKGTTDLRLLSIMFILFLSTIITQLWYSEIGWMESLRALAAYLNAIIVFFVIMRLDDYSVRRLNIVSLRVFVLLLLVGLMQYFQVFEGTGKVIDSIVPRGSWGALEVGGRGVPLLSTEPSRASVELIFLYAIVRYNVLPQVKLIGKYIFVFDVSVFLFVFVFLKSMAGLVFLVIFFLPIYRLPFALVLLAVVLGSSVYVENNRAFSVFMSLFSSGSFTQLFSTLLNASGFRVVSVLSAYYSGVLIPIGQGVGAWELSSIKSMMMAGFAASDIQYFRYFSSGDFIGVRPASFVSNLFLDIGLMGFLLVCYLLKGVLMEVVNLKPPFSIISLFLFSTFFFGAVGNPIPWICLALVLRTLQYTKKCSGSGLRLSAPEKTS